MCWDPWDWLTGFKVHLVEYKRRGGPFDCRRLFDISPTFRRLPLVPLSVPSLLLAYLRYSFEWYFSPLCRSCPYRAVRTTWSSMDGTQRWEIEACTHSSSALGPLCSLNSQMSFFVSVGDDFKGPPSHLTEDQV
jgi:hypothetical protein